MRSPCTGIFAGSTPVGSRSDYNHNLHAVRTGIRIYTYTNNDYLCSVRIAAIAVALHATLTGVRVPHRVPKNKTTKLLERIYLFICALTYTK